MNGPAPIAGHASRWLCTHAAALREQCRCGAGGGLARERGRQERCSVVALLVCVVLLTGCDQPQMANQPKYEPYENAPDWPDNQSARQPVEGTVARGDAINPPDRMPFEISRGLLEHGRERFEIYCTPCHGRGGHGNGMIAQRGFPQPPSFHQPRLRNVRLRHFYDVITNGFGVMYSYADRVPPDDRWAIAAYIRTLQYSQYAPVEALTPEQRQRLEGRS